MITGTIKRHFIGSGRSFFLGIFILTYPNVQLYSVVDCMAEETLIIKCIPVLFSLSPSIFLA